MNLKNKQFLDSYIGIPLAYIHILVARFLGKLLHRNHSISEPPKEICIIKLLGYGSVLMASDSILSIRKKYPDSRLSIICSLTIKEGILSLKLFDIIYVVDDRNLLSICISALRIVFQLAVKKKVWTIDLEVYSKLTSVLALWTFAVNRFGFYFNQVSFRDKLNTHNIYFNNLINVTENYHQMALTTGVTKFFNYHLPGYPPRNNQVQYDHIAINNTCSEFSPERKLAETQLHNLCDRVLGKTGFTIALLGAPSDKEANLRFIKKFFDSNTRIINIAGEMDLTDYYTFLYNNCSMMITIDSAPLHLARKLNIPTISVWGPTTPQSRMDNSPNDIFIYQPVVCSPCAHFINKLPCGGDNFCIKNISISTIVSAIDNIHYGF